MIDELGYESSLVAQSLRSQRTNVIGILVADLEPFSTELLKGAAEAIGGTRLRAGHLLGGGLRATATAGSGATCRASAAPWPTASSWSPRTRSTSAYGAPMVAVDPHSGPSDLPTIDSDNLKGAHWPPST